MSGSSPNPGRAPFGDPAVSEKLALDLGLTAEEYARLCQIAGGRTPSWTELGIASAMWSEHCSYKSSRRWLRLLPTKGSRVAQGPGENAGAVVLGDDVNDPRALCAVFKMESHNHPSFIEPFQGAATGVGGILRDIFTMGARPVCTLDALRFGKIGTPRTARLVQGVVAGISAYGNAIGVPTVGGDVQFDPGYDENILVNVMTVGVARRDRIFRGYASGIGNPVVYVGARTGKDGIHGATMASASFDAESEAKRPTVQVGDPFMEKLLLEACLELMGEGVPDGQTGPHAGCVVGIQDMGAAGLTSSSVEMAFRAGTGLRIDLDKVPRRAERMTPYELMLSESQERMLLVVQKGREAEALEVFTRWGLSAVVIGEVVEGQRLTLLATDENGGRQTVADLPVAPLADPPALDRPVAQPPRAADPGSLAGRALAPATNDELRAVLLELLATPGIASKSWIYRQYDTAVGTRTLLGPGGDAAVLALGEMGDLERPGLAATCDVNHRFTLLDPYHGTRLAVAESARNLVCVGAEPLAITNCLNFGNPQKPEVMWQLSEAIRGLAEAAEALGTPVVSGNVSLYNETSVVEARSSASSGATTSRGIPPTPTIGMIGRLPRAAARVPSGFPGPGLTVVLIGACTDELDGSAYAFEKLAHRTGTPPRLDWREARAVHQTVLEAARTGLLTSAHDCSDGGLAVALAECCVAELTTGAPGPTSVGAELDLGPIAAASAIRIEALLFGEAPSRVVVSCRAAGVNPLLSIAAAQGAPIQVLGQTQAAPRLVLTAGSHRIETLLDDLRASYGGGFQRAVLG
jgi:phosphoribosylformylglycinamidine synthase